MNGRIYKATNLISGKCYVGQTLYSLARRKSTHINSALRKQDKMIFHFAIRKYGSKNFEWEIIEECKTKDLLNEKEKYYIKELNTSVPNGYNLNNGGNSIAGFGQSEHSKRLSSERMKKNNPSFKHGKYVNIRTRIFHCIEPNCNNIISYSSALCGNGRCKSCAQKGERNSAKDSNVRKKLSERLSGSGNPMFGKKNPKRTEMNKKRRKTFLVTTLNNEEIIIKNLKLFCKENSLKYPTMIGLANNRWGKNKNGWKIEKL